MNTDRFRQQLNAKLISRPHIRLGRTGCTGNLELANCSGTTGAGYCRILAKDIKAIGLTNQRETTVVWDRRNGKPLAPAIIWQDRRATDWCNQLIQQGQMDQVQQNRITD